MSLLNLDYNHTTNIMIPVKRRTLTRFDWMRLMSFPLVTHNSNFYEFFDANRFAALHSSQVLSLEHYLNSVLNPINPIYIDNGESAMNLFIYVRGEEFSTPTYLYTRAEGEDSTYFYTRDEFNSQGIDFVVNLSAADSGLETKLQNYVEAFKPAGKIFIINIY